ncbi:Gfo/Idh/MocA family protein [Microlunatus soli]|uniref:Predicted dehydrogenase n=1 Tax=Microlunatus soli TaxID=630515 RepID=A0A1H1X6X4_9ACTN|nr:Gfo/Idh/MocA family oxidoreductase [Microlunatus soli]SDT04359.1 Predicted dehydrogenase [Microlunatus soli]
MITVGILGLGGIGSTHARALASLAEAGVAVRLIAYSGGSAALAADCGWPQARRLDPAELITDPDVSVIAICSPSGLHEEHALAALAAGKHVVVEKPMAVSTAGATAVRDRAERSGLIVSPLAQRRFEPLNVALRQAISSGKLGRIVLGETFVHWYRHPDYYREAGWRAEAAGGGGSLMNQGLHNVDLLCWLLGGVTRVTGLTATLGHDIATEDTAVAALQFTGGALGVVATTTATPPGTPSELSIWTSTGSARIDQNGIRAWDFAAVPRPAEPDLAVTGASDPAAIGISGHLAQWSDVLDAVITGRRPMITADDGVATVSVLDGIYRAAADGRTVSGTAGLEVGR